MSGSKISNAPRIIRLQFLLFGNKEDYMKVGESKVGIVLQEK